MIEFLTHPLIVALYIGVGGFGFDRLVVWPLWCLWKERVQTNDSAKTHDKGRDRPANIEKIHNESARQQD